ncbi:MAG: hypothetical protein LBS52_01460 [Dysgonamonadaceae bacterium]|jgi:hypothetical protein|nr:hypothetical protein [Dysgonamonadaceae bacterium]
MKNILLILGMFVLLSFSITRNNRKNILGIWWDANDKDAPAAEFAIRDSTIWYENTNEEYKYQLKKDSLIVFFPDDVLRFKIEKLTKDTLVLKSEYGKGIYIKKVFNI